MTAEVILLLAAIFFTAVAVLGGGFTAKEIAVPTVPGPGRIASAGLALMFFVGSGFLILAKPNAATTEASDAPPVAAVVPSPSPSPSAETSPTATTPTIVTTPTAESTPAPSPTDTPSPSVLSPTNDASQAPSDQQTLLGMLPASVADYCVRDSDLLTKLETRVSLRCELPELQVDFHWFASRARINGVFDEDTERAGVANDGGCSSDDWSHVGTWSRDGSAKPTGRLLCFVDDDDGEARVVWTYRGMNLFAHAVRPDGDADALRGWWSVVAAEIQTT